MTGFTHQIGHIWFIICCMVT